MAGGHNGSFKGLGSRYRYFASSAIEAIFNLLLPGLHLQFSQESSSRLPSKALLSSLGFQASYIMTQSVPACTCRGILFSRSLPYTLNLEPLGSRNSFVQAAAVRFGQAMNAVAKLKREERRVFLDLC